MQQRHSLAELVLESADRWRAPVTSMGLLTPQG
jgi:hypothetical protein